MFNNNKSGEYNGIYYESDSEYEFLLWAWELKVKGIIVDIQRPQSFVLTEGLVMPYNIQLKTKIKIKNQKLLRPSLYTPDYVIEWNKEQCESFIWLKHHNTKFNKLFFGHTKILDGSIYTFIEVKPAFDMQNMTREFVLKQKMMYQVHNIFINLIKPIDLYKKTFVPQDYLLTPTGRQKKINFNYILIDDYLKTL